VCRSPPANSVGVVATVRSPQPEVVSDAVTHRVRTSVGLEALDVQAQALGACLPVRVLKPTLLGEQRVVRLPERVLRAAASAGDRPAERQPGTAVAATSTRSAVA
jgi:hypothetical protein